MRCNNCRTYINPFWGFQDGGSKSVCNICGKLETVPSYYFSKLNEDGERYDKLNRPELHLGSYEIKAGAE